MCWPWSPEPPSPLRPKAMAVPWASTPPAVTPMGAPFVREVRGRGRSHSGVRCATSCLHKEQPRRGRGQPPPRTEAPWGLWRRQASEDAARAGCGPSSPTPRNEAPTGAGCARAGVSSRPCWISALQEESRRSGRGRVGAKGLCRDQPGAASCFSSSPCFSWPDALDRELETKCVITC